MLKIGTDSQYLTIDKDDSKSSNAFGIIVSLRELYTNKALLVIGSPGLPNVTNEFQVGEAVLFETPNEGLIEIRYVTKVSSYSIKVLLTRVSPKLGFTAGYQDDGGQNSPFSSDERNQIKIGMETVLQSIKERADLSPEQFELISRKLDDLVAASSRLGRKDWIMYAMGNLTNVVTTAALSSEATRIILTTLNDSLGWIFQNGIRFLGS